MKLPFTSRLARKFGLHAEIQQVSLDDIAKLLAQGQWVIVYLNRLPIDRVFAIHAVIPIRLTQRFVTVLDPRLGERRISRRKLGAARRYLSNFGVICGPFDLSGPQGRRASRTG